MQKHTVNKQKAIVLGVQALAVGANIALFAVHPWIYGMTAVAATAFIQSRKLK